MKISINYYKTVNEALAAVSESSFGFEIIGAENVTKKADFEKRVAEFCKDMPFCMVDFVFTPECTLVGGDLYSDRFDTFYEVWSSMLGCWASTSTSSSSLPTSGFDGRYDYHVLASLG